MHNMGSQMTSGVGLAGIIGLVVVALVIVALIKYVFFR